MAWWNHKGAANTFKPFLVVLGSIIVPLILLLSYFFPCACVFSTLSNCGSKVAGEHAQALSNATEQVAHYTQFTI